MASASSSAVADEARLPFNSGSEDEVMETHNTQDACPHSEEERTTFAWILNARRARRSRDQRLLTAKEQLTQTLEKPSLRKSRPTGRKPRQPPLPFEDLKLAFRPRNGLRLARVSTQKLLMAVATEANLQVGAVTVRMRIDGDQNVIVLSTPSEATAIKLRKVKKLTIDGNTYEVASHPLSPATPAKESFITSTLTLPPKWFSNPSRTQVMKCYRAED